MTRVDEFDHFYASTSGTTLRATYAVSGDRNVALESTIDAYRHAWRDWNKIRNHEPDAWVRNEAWRLTALSRSTHPLRQRHEEDSDRELLSALAAQQIEVEQFAVGNPSLDEVFLALTGHPAEAETPEAAA